MKTWLIDTGPLVAYLDSDDEEHDQVVALLDEFRGQLCTTSAVIIEAMHFVSSEPDGPTLLVDFVVSSGMLISECTQPGQLKRSAMLMKKYEDTPMDFADATLVLLADELEIREILTFDRRGFSTFRTAKGKAFVRILD
jgi:hypothetical protein